MDTSGVAWSNGSFQAMEEIKLFPYFRGLQYGDGFFETLRADSGKVYYLDQHLKRLASSAKAFNINFSTDADWQAVISQLLALNDLQNSCARIKIILCRGPVATLGLPGPEKEAVLITASPYSPPDAAKLAQGVKLITYSSDCPNNLSGHKSLNYLFYLVSRQYALSIGYDDAIIVDSDGRISETSTGTLLFNYADIWLTPESWYQLPGITIAAVKEIFKAENLAIERKVIKPFDLADISKAFVINSLTGLQPVSRIGKISYKNIDVEFAEKINRQLFS